MGGVEIYSARYIFVNMETQEDRIIRKLESFYGTNRIAYCEINGDKVSFGVFQNYSHDKGNFWIYDCAMSIQKLNRITNE